MYRKSIGHRTVVNSVRTLCLFIPIPYLHIFMHPTPKNGVPPCGIRRLYSYYCSGVGSGSGSGAGGSVSVTGSVTVSVAVSVFVDTSVVSLGCVKDGVVSVAFFVSVETEVVVVVFEVVVVVI